MDDKWFKAQQKKVGITADAIAAVIGRDRSVVSKILSGKQRMTLEWAQAFAAALQVDVATVLEKAGVAEAPLVQAISPGFSDSDVTPWLPKSEGGDVRTVPTVAEALGGNRPGIDIWRVKGLAMSQHGLLPGDYMLVDTHQAERVKPGDVVVAQVYNRTGAITVLRTYAPPVLMSADPADAQVHVVDGVNVVIRGKVTASWRV